MDDVERDRDCNVFNKIKTIHVEFDSKSNDVLFAEPKIEEDEDNINNTSMETWPPNLQREMEFIWAWVKNPNTNLLRLIDWPSIGASPMN